MTMTRNIPKSGLPSKLYPRADPEMLRETTESLRLHLRLYRPL